MEAEMHGFEKNVCVSGNIPCNYQNQPNCYESGKHKYILCSKASSTFEVLLYDSYSPFARGLIRMKASVLIIAVIAATILRGTDAQEKNCKAAVSDMLKYQMSSISKCTKQLGYKGKEKTEKMNCIMKCVLIASGALKPDGKIEIENAMAFILENIPLDFLEKALKGSMKCQRFMNGLDPNEANCKSYEPLVKCLTGFIMSMCNK